MMSKKLLELVKKEMPDAVLGSHSRLGNDTVITSAERVHDVLLFLFTDERAKTNMLRELTAVDYLNRVPRFEVVYVVYSLEHKHQLVVRAVANEDNLKVPTASDIWPVAGWMEREVWDMYGVVFEGHPDLRRVLLYEEFDGHPLRKDYAIQASQPRIELRARERDSVEEFLEFHKGKESAGSREHS